MKILSFNYKHKDIELIPEDFEDLYFLSILIKKGDVVYAWTTRHVKPRAKDEGRPDRGDRVRVYLGIEVENVEITGFREALRVKGKVIEAPDWLAIKGRYHSLTIGRGTPLRVIKQHLLEYELKRLKKLSIGKKRRILIVALDYDEATIALLHDLGIEILETKSISLPGKSEEKGRRAVISRFFKSLIEIISRIVQREDVKDIVLAGPGLAKVSFKKYLLKEIPRVKVFIEDATSSNESGVYEVIRRGIEVKILKEYELIEAQRILMEVLARIGRNDPRVIYGLDEVEKVAGMGVIESLVVGEDLLRNPTLSERVVSVMETVERYRGKVMLLNHKAEYYPTLKSLGSIAGLLRYSIRAM